MPANSPLPTMTLGSSGFDITRVGFGAWAVGGPWQFGWGEQDDAESVAAIRRAVEAGVNWIDTAAVYGLGHSEEVVRQAMSGYAADDRPYVFTKCGMWWADGSQEVTRDARHVREECERSLRRLGVEVIDLYQVHWPDETGLGVQDYWAELVALREEGKVRAIGLSNHDVAQHRAAQAIGQVDSSQPPFSLLHRDAAGDVIPWCEANTTGVIVYSPMQSGLLTGAFSAERVAALDEDDWRRRDPDFTTDLDRNLTVAAALEPIAQRHDVPVPAVAVAWTLAWPGVTAAIVGARRPGQVEGWLPAADLTLTTRDLEDLAVVLDRSGAGSGPKNPIGVTAAPGAGGHASAPR